jgi:iron complex outermembrane receptor protein
MVAESAFEAMRIHRYLPILTLFLVWASAADAQTLSGRVADSQGAVVVGADVRLSGAGLPAPRATRSAADGTFAFDNVAPGRYAIRADFAGFAIFASDVTMLAGGLSVPITLQVAGFTEDLRVQGEVLDSSLTKSNVPLQDQPMNVSVISGEFLRTFGVNDLVSALANVAGVSAYQQYGVYEHTTLRGFSEGAQMVDGIRREGNRVRSILSNVERIEVLKGPAAVLSGNEAIGSSTNVVLKKPTAQPMYEYALTYGSWNTVRSSGAASGRLARTPLLYRVDAGVDVADNFRHDPWNKFNITPSMVWQVSRNDRVEARYSLSRNDVSGDSGIPLVPRGDGTFFIPDVPRDTRYNTPQDFALSYEHNVRLDYSRTLGDHATFRNVYAPTATDDEYWVAETFNVPLGSNDVTRTFLYFKHRQRPWTNLAEFSGRFTLGVRHNVLAGWDHQDYQRRTTRSANANITTTRINLFDPVETHQTWTDFTISRYDYQQNYTEGVYLQDHVEIGSKLKAVVLGRADYVDRSTYGNPVTNGVETPGTVTKSKQRRISSRYGIVYQPVSRVDVYAQYATSFKPNFNLQSDGTELKPEIGAQWEVGNRVRLLENRMYLNTSAYHIERQNVALSRPGGFFDQAGKIRSQGAEVELDAQWSSLYVRVGYGYTDAEYLDYVTTNNAGVPTVLSGKIKPRTPTNTFNYQAGKNWRNGLTLAVSGRSHGKQFLDDANTLSFESYSLLDLAAQYKHGSAIYTLNFSNLTNTEYWASVRGNRQFYPGEPLRVMASVRLSVN